MNKIEGYWLEKILMTNGFEIEELQETVAKEGDIQYPVRKLFSRLSERYISLLVQLDQMFYGLKGYVSNGQLTLYFKNKTYQLGIIKREE